MMRPKSLVLLALALGCGLVASIGISQVIDSNKQNNKSAETVPIYIALQQINLGDPVDDTMVSLQEWPKDKVPVGAITSWEDIDERRPRTVIFQGEPILDSKMLEKGQTQDPISAIPEGMRLKTVSVDARKSAAGLLSPGDRVDLQLYVHRNERENIPHPFTKIILQNIRVFAIDQSVDRSPDGVESRSVAKTVSLIVTPSQANRITTAENLGEISLIPRHPDDDKVVDDAEEGTDFLFSNSDANSREKEQGDRAEEDENGFPGGFDPALAAVDPPFRMTVIYPEDREELLFSSDTGEPLYDEKERDTPRGNGSGGSGGNDGFVPSGDDVNLDDLQGADFPIDLKR